MKERRNTKIKCDWLRNIIQLDTVVILPVVLILQAFLLAFGMQAITFADYNILYKWCDVDNYGYLIYNVLLLYVVLQLFVCLFKRVTPGFVIVLSFTVVMSIINNMKWNNLKECVTISDFEKLSEAIQVAGEAEFKMFSEMWVCLVVGILSLFLLIALDCKVLRDMRRNSDKKRTCRITLILFVVILIPVVAIDAKKSAVAKLTESRTADKTGPIVYFVESIFTS